MYDVINRGYWKLYYLQFFCICKLFENFLNIKNVYCVIECFNLISLLFNEICLSFVFDQELVQVDWSYLDFSM